MRCIPFVLIAVLCCCAATCQTRPTTPQVIEVPGPTKYVEIEDKLVQHPPLPPLVDTRANPLQCPAVANERRELLRDAYLNLDAIDAVEGTKVP